MAKMSDQEFASRFRDVVTRIVRRTIRDMRPEVRMGRVFSFDPVSSYARILFPGETVDSLVKVRVPQNLNPTITMNKDFATLGYSAPADVVRVWGKPGAYYILGFHSGSPAVGPPGQFDASLVANLANQETDGAIAVRGQRAFVETFPYLKAQLAKRGTKRIIFAMTGDSITEGVWAGPPAYKNRWQAHFQAMMRASYPVEGVQHSVGYMPAYYADALMTDDTVRDLAKTYVEFSWLWGPGGRAIALPNETPLTFPPVYCSKFRVWYGMTDYLGGSFKIFVNDADVTSSATLSNGNTPYFGTIVTNGTSKSDGYYAEIAGLDSSIPVTVKVVGSYAGGNGIVTGIEFLGNDDTSGIMVLDNGHSGAKMSDYARSTLMNGMVKKYADDGHIVVPVISVGTNDSSVGAVTPAQFEEAARQTRDLFDAALGPDYPCVWVQQQHYEGDAVKDQTWTEYREALRRVANERPDKHKTFDMHNSFHAMKEDGSTNWGLFTEATKPVHLTNAGSIVFSDAMAREFSAGNAGKTYTRDGILDRKTWWSYRSGDTFTSNSTEWVDSGLKFYNIPPGAYELTGFLVINSPASADLKFVWNILTGSVAGKWGLLGIGTGQTTESAATMNNLAVAALTDTINTGTSGGYSSARVDGHVVVSGNSSASLNLRWAQRVAQTPLSIIYGPGSYVKLTRME